MKKLKVMTVVGTRPEIIRLSRVLAKLDEHCEHVLVHTGQNYDYELSQVFSTWKQATDVLTSVCQKKPTDESWTTRPT